MAKAEFEAYFAEKKMNSTMQKFGHENIYRIKELLTAEHRSSFIFNQCVGAAAILEYSNEGNIQIVLVNDKFSEINGAIFDDVSVNGNKESQKFSPEDAKVMGQMEDVS